jgi:coenzyme Q-binding protein COQ10
MPKFTTVRRVPLAAAQAYAIAADVASYKDFLPLVQRSVIRGQRRPEGTGESFDAELAVAYEKLRLRESFISRVTLEPDQLRVTARSSDGPVKALETVWQIRPLAPNTCEVSFIVDYTMRSLPLQLVVGSAFGYAVDRIMAAFEARGRQLYPTVSA